MPLVDKKCVPKSVCAECCRRWGPICRDNEYTVGYEGHYCCGPNPCEIMHFFSQYGIDNDRLNWAVKNCDTMQEFWDKADGYRVVEIACYEGVLTNPEIHQFVLFCANQARGLMKDDRSRNAIFTKERWINGCCADNELSKAATAASVARGIAMRDKTIELYSSDHFISEVEYGVVSYRSRESLHSATTIAGHVSCAIGGAATTGRYVRGEGYIFDDEAKREAACKQVRAAQAKWLREHTKPCFGQRRYTPTMAKFCEQHKFDESMIKRFSSPMHIWEKGSVDEVLKLAACEGVLTKHQIRTFAAHCAYSVKHLMSENGATALGVLRDFLYGEATQEQLETASNSISGTSTLPENMNTQEMADYTAFWALRSHTDDSMLLHTSQLALNAVEQNFLENNGPLEQVREQHIHWLRECITPNFGEGEKPDEIQLAEPQYNTAKIDDIYSYHGTYKPTPSVKCAVQAKDEETANWVVGVGLTIAIVGMIIVFYMAS